MLPVAGVGGFLGGRQGAHPLLPFSTWRGMFAVRCTASVLHKCTPLRRTYVKSVFVALVIKSLVAYPTTPLVNKRTGSGCQRLVCFCFGAAAAGQDLPTPMTYFGSSSLEDSRSPTSSCSWEVVSMVTRKRGSFVISRSARYFFMVSMLWV